MAAFSVINGGGTESIVLPKFDLLSKQTRGGASKSAAGYTYVGVYV